MERDAYSPLSFDSSNRRRESLPDNTWHLDKRINVSHLVATVLLFAGLMAWGSRVDTRLAVLETQDAVLDDLIARQSAEHNRDMARLESALQRHYEALIRIEDKLDEQAAVTRQPIQTTKTQDDSQ